MALPMISMAARLQLDQNDIVKSVRITLGPAGPVPHLAEAAMDVLAGAKAETEQFSRATQAVLDSVSLRTSKYRATQQYREEMIRTHLPLVLFFLFDGKFQSQLARSCPVPSRQKPAHHLR